MIRLKDVTFSYDDTTFIKNMDFDLKPGWTSVVGPNGAGKSTMIQLMNGTIKPESGEILLKDKAIDSYSSMHRARQITTIVQQPQLRFPITCFEMVSYGRYPWREDMNGLTDKDYHVIEKSMQDTGILGFRDKKVTELSGGEKQRVVLATALCQEPKVLLIDEGFSALDIKHKSEMVHCIKERIHSDNLIVVAIIHDLNVAYQISNQVVMLKNGSMIESGNKDNVMTKETIETIYETNVNFDKEFGFSMKMSFDRKN